MPIQRRSRRRQKVRQRNLTAVLVKVVGKALAINQQPKSQRQKNLRAKKKVAQISKLEPKNESADSPNRSEPAESQKSKGQQYGITALFWVTFLAGLTISYFQRLDAPEIIEGGIASIVIGLFVGVVIGGLSGNLRNAIFWSTLIAAFGYMSVAKDPHFDVWHRVAWGTVGATCGAVGCSLLVNRFFFNAILCGLFAELVMIGFAWLAGINSSDMRFDVLPRH